MFRKRICVRVLCGLLLTAMLSICSVYAFAANPVQDARESVVHIWVFPKYSGNLINIDDRWQGSGFIVDKDLQYIVTNAHVAADTENMLPNGTDLVILVQHHQKMYLSEAIASKITSTDSAPGIDLAILKTTSPIVDGKPIPICKDSVDVTETVYTLGFPDYSQRLSREEYEEDQYELSLMFALNTFPFDLSSIPDTSQDVTITKGTVSRVTEENGAKFIQSDANTGHGNSGGPMINENGAVVGINTFLSLGEDNTSAGYAVSAQHAIELLDSFGIEYTTVGNEETVSDTAEPITSPVPTKEPNKPDVADIEANTPGLSTETNASDSTGIILVIAGVALITIVAAVYFGKRIKDKGIEKEKEERRKQEEERRRQEEERRRKEEERRKREEEECRKKASAKTLWSVPVIDGNPIMDSQAKNDSVVVHSNIKNSGS